MFYDPSGWFLQRCQSIPQFFDKSDNVIPYLQELIEPEDAGTTYSGRCSTLVLLLIICCLRFSCHDIARMVYILRCVLADRQAARTTLAMLLTQWRPRLFPP